MFRRIYRVFSMVFAVLLLAISISPFVAVAQASPASYYTYTGIWNGQTVNLTLVPNITVEGLSDAKLVGQITNFYTNEPNGSKPPFYELKCKL